MKNELFDLLIERKITVATAESCTGGNIAARFVAYPGISEIFLAGLVTYANSAKTRLLGVSEETLQKAGAVSIECAEEMLIGAQKATGALLTICTTGIAGPGGATKDKPVGLVYVGVRYLGTSIVEKCQFSGDREDVIRQATDHALQMIPELLDTLKEIIKK